MSENDLGSQEKIKEVVITAEDCNAALDFWKHFNIPIPDALESAMSAFSKDPCFENQNKVKLELCLAIATSTHEAFKDDMFVKIKEECRGATYEISFDENLEEALRED
jgi:hypothetical protein